jgi:DnaJ-class molecular chaperone
MAKNYYQILGLPDSANADEIKSAYRRKAKIAHPDHSGKPSGAFLEIKEAYDTLSDSKKREAYDAAAAAPVIKVRSGRRVEPFAPGEVFRTRPRAEPMRQSDSERPAWRPGNDWPFWELF